MVKIFWRVILAVTKKERIHERMVYNNRCGTEINKAADVALKISAPKWGRFLYGQICATCYNIVITRKKKVRDMLIKIDFNSDEAIYMQLRNQIILGIATSRIQEGDSLPSVRQLAEEIGINMHTVNKAYAVLREEGIIHLDRRRGAVIAIDINRLQALDDMKRHLTVVLAKGRCKNITKEDVYALVDEIYDELRG